MHDNILDNFEFERSRAKVKVTVAIFRKNIVIALVMSLFYYPRVGKKSLRNWLN